MNLREAFEETRAQFDRESHKHPGLRHFWLQAVHFVHTPVLESVAQIYDQPLAEVTQWPRENDRIDFSCFVGSKEQVECFSRIAEQSRHLFVQLYEHLVKSPRHTPYPPYIPWLADLYYLAKKDPKPQLGVKDFALGEWSSTAKGATTVLQWALDEQSEAQLQSLRTKLGKPIAVHRVQVLVQNVFTASATMIADILKEAIDDPQVGAGLDTSVHGITILTSAGENLPSSTVTSTAADSGASRTRSAAIPPTRPSWVNQAELIGPISHVAFAQLLMISATHLYRLIQKGPVWKERGPSANKFYFYHRDPSIHRRLREAFERDRSKNR